MDGAEIWRGGCTRGGLPRWFEKLVDAAFRNGATDIYARVGSKFVFRIGGEMQVLGTHVVRPGELEPQMREVLTPDLWREWEEEGDLAFEYVVVPWLPVEAHMGRSSGGMALVVRVPGFEEERLKSKSPPEIAPEIWRAPAAPTGPVNESEVAKNWRESLESEVRGPALPSPWANGDDPEQDADECLRAGVLIRASSLVLVAGMHPVYVFREMTHEVREWTPKGEELNELVRAWAPEPVYERFQAEGAAKFPRAVPTGGKAIVFARRTGMRFVVIVQFSGAPGGSTPPDDFAGAFARLPKDPPFHPRPGLRAEPPAAEEPPASPQN